MAGWVGGLYAWTQDNCGSKLQPSERMQHDIAEMAARAKETTNKAYKETRAMYDALANGSPERVKTTCSKALGELQEIHRKTN